MFKLLFKIFDFFTDIRLAKKIKADPEKQPTSKRFGFSTIWCSLGFVIGCALAGLVIWLALSVFTDVLSAVGLIIAAAIGIGIVFTLLHILKNWFLQLYINKSTITWVSLLVMLAAFVAGAIILWFFIVKK